MQSRTWGIPQFWGLGCLLHIIPCLVLCWRPACCTAATALPLAAAAAAARRALKPASVLAACMSHRCDRPACCMVQSELRWCGLRSSLHFKSRTYASCSGGHYRVGSSYRQTRYEEAPQQRPQTHRVAGCNCEPFGVAGRQYGMWCSDCACPFTRVSPGTSSAMGWSLLLLLLWPRL